MSIEEIEEIQKIEKKYSCIHCDYNCLYLSDWNKHLLTRKHKKHEKMSIEEIEEPQKIEKNEKNNICENCNKEFKTNSGLWKHKNSNKCEKYNNDNGNNNTLITLLLQQNAELIKTNTEITKEQSSIKELILEIVKNGVNNCNNTTNTITNTNSNNKAFNLQFYLNETCKNAMNMSDFIDSINLQLSDLISVGELGYVEGISKIIIDNLNRLDATERPVNCTDKKRDTIYIKDDNKWEKDEENKKITSAVKKVAFKNTKLFPQFKQKYPTYCNSESKYSDQYSNIVIQSLDDSRENNEKIVKNISKKVLIEK